MSEEGICLDSDVSGRHEHEGVEYEQHRADHPADLPPEATGVRGARGPVHDVVDGVNHEEDAREDLQSDEGVEADLIPSLGEVERARIRLVYEDQLDEIRQDNEEASQGAEHGWLDHAVHRSREGPFTLVEVVEDLKGVGHGGSREHVAHVEACGEVMNHGEGGQEAHDQPQGGRHHGEKASLEELDQIELVNEVGKHGKHGCHLSWAYRAKV